MEKIYIKSPEFIFRKISGEMILVPLKSKATDLPSIYTLNESGARIWELIDGRKSLAEIKDKLTEEFEVDTEQLEKDLVEFLNKLKQINAIQEVG
ncbi:MAG: PqqD family protein [Candidatus Omnitrophica bacterium]|nr:PqqD family protein [Candidatus Omnitrophota bacterium]